MKLRIQVTYPAKTNEYYDIVCNDDNIPRLYNQVVSKIQRDLENTDNSMVLIDYSKLYTGLDSQYKTIIINCKNIENIIVYPYYN